MIPSTGPNLAREPFANTRPLLRLSILLWLLALALGAWNVHAYFASGAGASARRAELERLRAENAESRRRIETLDADLRRAELERVNLQTEYLNQRIAERAFSWNLLFDDLVAVMPRQVRVQRLAPEGFRDDRAARTGQAPVAAERRVTLRISGEAADDESLLDFIDGLFSHPSFDSPNLASEARTRAGGLDFELTVGYLPAGSTRDLGGVPAVAEVAPGAVSEPRPATTTRAAAGAPAPGVGAEARAGATTPAPATGSAPATTTPDAPGRDRPAVAATAPAADRNAPRAPASAPSRASAGNEGDAGAADAAVAPPDGAPAPAPTPALSIFGVPLGAKPYASGGLP